ncbi:hypothetical protein H0H93_013928, partial [Arthromyces matolae]
MSVSKSEPSLPSRIDFASPQTPDLVSDVSETATQSSFSLESPPRNGREDMQKVDDADSTLTIPHGDFFETSEDIIAEDNDSQMGTGVNASPQLFNTPMSRGSPLLLGAAGSPQASPTRSPLVPTTAGTASTSKLTSQVTGTTTIARQFTGIGSGSDPGLLRQLTGGGLSPTRSISPTKQLSMGRPRPKSVIGMRSTKSVDEGRGMFLVRQMT